MRLKLFILVIACLPLWTQAQEKNYQKALDLYMDRSYEKALKKIEKAVQHEDTRSLAEVHLLHAKIWLAINDDAELIPDYPKALQESLKAAAKALGKSKDPASLRLTETEFFQDLTKQTMDAGNAELGAGRYNQAQKYFEKILEINESLEPRWALARVALAQQDTVTALDRVKSITAIVLDSSWAVGKKAEVSDQAFVFYVEYYIGKKKYDTAAYLAERFVNLDPASKKLEAALLKSFLLFVTNDKPSEKTLELFARMRPRFQEDSLFIQKENVLFMYMMNQYAANGYIAMSDSLLSGYLALKKQYYEIQGETYLKKDRTYNRNQQEFLFNLIRYTARYERKNFLSVLVEKYVSGEVADSVFRKKNNADRWKQFFSRVKEEKNLFLLSTSIPLAENQLSREKWFAPYKRGLVEEAFKNQNTFRDRTLLLKFIPTVMSMYPKDLPLKKEAEKMSYHIIREYGDSNYYSHTRLAILQHDRFFASSTELRELKKAFVIKDFRDNYYGSRLLKDSVNGKPVNEFIWNGNEQRCDAGSVPSTVQNKVEQRINYFRRTAGVPDYVELDSARNAACQRAALIYQVNTGKQHTEPAETWKCYTLSSVDAARFSGRVMGQTTVFAVTSLMADQGEKNTSVGNRRWLLNPASRVMGHGSTSRVSFIWTLDDQGDRDTTAYTREFVSWPPKDFCPVMFAFDRWHFSMYADLSKASVSISLDGKEMPLTLETLVSGYGMPSLVWKPGFSPETGKDYVVTVKNVLLHGEKTPKSYTYTVQFIDPMK